MTAFQNVIPWVMIAPSAASPIKIATDALEAGKTAASWIQKWKAKAEKEMAADRQLVLGSSTEDERAVRLAKAV